MRLVKPKCTVIRSFFSDFCDGPKYAFNSLFSNAGDLVIVELMSLLKKYQKSSLGVLAENLYKSSKSSMGQKSLIQSRLSLRHLGWLQYFFRLKSDTLNYN